MLRRALASSWPAFGATLIGIAAVLLRFHVGAPDLARYAVYLVGAVALPGVFTWRALLASLHDGDRAPTWFEDLTLGTIFGLTLQLPFFLASVALGMPLLILTPTVLAVALSPTRWGREVWRLPTRRLDARASWLLGAVILYGTLWMAWNDFVERPLNVPAFRVVSADVTFHQALIADISRRFPAEIPWLLGTDLDYHWFVHAQIAASNTLTGMDSLTMLRLVMPTLTLALGVAGLAAVAMRLSGRTVAAVIAPTLLVVGSYHLMGPDFPTRLFYEPYLTGRFISSPSHAYAVAVSMPVVMLVLEVLRPRVKAPGAVWIALTLAALGLSGAKATFLPIFVCGAIGVWGVEVLRTRRFPRTPAMLTLLMVAVFGFGQFVLLGGQTGDMEIAPFRTIARGLIGNDLPRSPLNVALMTLATLTGWLLYGIGAVGLKRKLLDPRAVFILVSISAGITVPFLLYRMGLSQLWFSRAVAELIVLISAWGMARVLPRPLSNRQGLLYGALAVLSGTVAYLVSVWVQEIQGTGEAQPASMLLTAAFPVAIGAGYFVIRLLSRSRHRPGPPLAVLLTVLLGLSLSNVMITLSRGEEPGPEPRGRGGLFERGGAQAAEHIAEHSPVDSVVATNIHCLRPGAATCDFRSFWVSAYTGRRVVMEGWGYTAVAKKARAANKGQGGQYHLPVPYPERLAMNDAVFTEPTVENLRRLVDTYGVDWLFVGKKHDADLPGLRNLTEDTDLVSVAFENKNYVVYRVGG